MLFDRRNRRLDIRRLLADDADAGAARRRFLGFVKAFQHTIDDRQSVGAALLQDRELHRRFAVEFGIGSRFGQTVIDARHVGKQNLSAALRAQHDVVELLHRSQAAQRAQRQFARALIDVAAGNFDVLRLQRFRHVVHRQIDGAQFIGVEPDIDLARLAAAQIDFADAVGRFDLATQRFIGVFRDLADRLLRRNRDRHDRNLRRIEAAHNRRIDVFGQVALRQADFIAHFLRRHVHVFFQNEGDGDGRNALAGRRAHFVDARQSSNRVLDFLGDFGLDRFRRAARQRRDDRHRRKIDFGKAVDAEPEKRRRADHHQNQDQHRRKHRTTHANFR